MTLFIILGLGFKWHKLYIYGNNYINDMIHLNNITSIYWPTIVLFLLLLYITTRYNSFISITTIKKN